MFPTNVHVVLLVQKCPVIVNSRVNSIGWLHLKEMPLSTLPSTNLFETGGFTLLYK